MAFKWVKILNNFGFFFEFLDCWTLIKTTQNLTPFSLPEVKNLCINSVPYQVIIDPDLYHSAYDVYAKDQPHPAIVQAVDHHDLENLQKLIHHAFTLPEYDPDFEEEVEEALSKDKSTKKGKNSKGKNKNKSKSKSKSKANSMESEAMRNNKIKLKISNGEKMR